MANKTLNNVTDKLDELAGKHPMINDVGSGHTTDIGTKREEGGRELVYPYLWYDYKDVRYVVTKNQRGIAYKLYTFQFMVMDKYTPNQINSKEVMSDTEGILSDFIQKLVNDRSLKEFIIEEGTIAGTPVRDDEKDGVEGWLIPLAFKIPYSFCAKNLPFLNGN